MEADDNPWEPQKTRLFESGRCAKLRLEKAYTDDAQKRLSAIGAGQLRLPTTTAAPPRRAPTWRWPHQPPKKHGAETQKTHVAAEDAKPTVDGFYSIYRSSQVRRKQDCHLRPN